MDSPERAEPSQQTPLDAERAKLRAAGYTEHEISQILIAKAAAPHTTSGGLGVMSGALNNFTAALATARGAIPNMLTDIESIFGAGVARVTRIKALVAFTFKAVLIGALGFAVYQEWQQHIISATEIAVINARKAHYEECIAHANAVRQTWTTGAWTQVIKDCALKEPNPPPLPPPASAKSGSDRAAELHSIFQDSTQAQSEFKAGHYAEALKFEEKYAARMEAFEKEDGGKAGTLTAMALRNISIYALLVRDFEKALRAAEHSIQVEPRLVAETNRAHALMFLGRVKEAKALYLAHKGEALHGLHVEGETWDKAILEDFDGLRKAGLTHPLMGEIEAALR